MLKSLNRFLCSFVFLVQFSSPSLGQDTGEEDQSNKQTDLQTPNNATAGKNRDVEQEKQALLWQELSEDSRIWLETDEEKFIALWEPDTSGNPFGAILMLHGAGQTVDWPDSLNPVRVALPHYGWSTLSISLPPMNTGIAENRDSSDPQNPPSEENTPQHASHQRIHAATQFLKQKGQYNIVLLGEGLGAKRAAQYIEQIAGKPAQDQVAATKAKAIIQRPIRALIMMNARNISSDDSPSLPLLLRDRYLPLLDLYYGEHYLDESEAMTRLIAAKKHRLLHYQQFHILEPPAKLAVGKMDNRGENRVTRRIRGFLNKYAKGVEIEGSR